MRFYVGITDPNWFHYLSQLKPEDVNFWRPGMLGFKAIPQGAPFVFKLKGSINKIAGVGFFYQYIKLPMSVAWDTFGHGNGSDFYSDFVSAVERLRSRDNQQSTEVGCIVLTNPVFFEEQDWIEMPPEWKKNIQQGLTYSTEDHVGKSLWAKIELLLYKYLRSDIDVGKSLAALNTTESPGYNSIISKVRIGQGAFRVSVTTAYQRRCSITGEKTLPALEAAHIKSYAKSGPNLPSNGLLLRSDIHKLFDTGYITIDSDLRIAVSSRIRTEFENGKEYYQFHGRRLFNTPAELVNRPKTEYLLWHNENVFR